ncbi:hypothetical protein FHS27_004903 [Rhodopirellula rubra]|uniref:Uncharacterized protein n=1 Tax=Aporhodopirellula rubra TaxID=980271 RepID=A0A7W5E3B4_9BACT|nr:hypothetical protein [Aporhodopirellula rubra]
MNQQPLFDAGLPVFSAFVGRPIELSSKGDKSRAAQLALLIRNNCPKGDKFGETTCKLLSTSG